MNCGCGNPCDHGFGGYAADHLGNRVPGPGYGQIAIDRTVDPWDTSQWGITEWAAAAGLVLSVVWVWNLTMKGK